MMESYQSNYESNNKQILIKYPTCEQGGVHTGEPLNLVSLEDEDANKELICQVCIQTINRGKQYVSLKKLLLDTEAQMDSWDNLLETIDASEQETLKLVQQMYANMKEEVNEHCIGKSKIRETIDRIYNQKYDKVSKGLAKEVAVLMSIKRAQDQKYRANNIPNYYIAFEKATAKVKQELQDEIQDMIQNMNKQLNDQKQALQRYSKRVSILLKNPNTDAIGRESTRNFESVGKITNSSQIIERQSIRNSVRNDLDRSRDMYQSNQFNDSDLLIGHKDMINQVAFSPKGNLIGSASNDGEIIIWDANSLIKEYNLHGHSSYVTCLSFSPVGRKLVSGSFDQEIRIWNLDSKDCTNILNGHEQIVISVSFSSDGRKIASSSCDKTVKIWDALHGECLQTFRGHSGYVWQCQFNPNDQYIASIGADNSLKIWDLEYNELKISVQVQNENTGRCCLNFSPTGRYIATGGPNGVLKIWDASNLECLIEINDQSSSWIRSLSFSPDGRKIATGNDDFCVKIYDIQSKKLESQLKGHNERVWSIDYSPDGKKIISGSQDKTIRIWGAGTDNYKNRK